MTARFSSIRFGLVVLALVLPGCPIAESFDVDSDPVEGVELKPGAEGADAATVREPDSNPQENGSGTGGSRQEDPKDIDEGSSGVTSEPFGAGGGSGSNAGAGGASGGADSDPSSPGTGGGNFGTGGGNSGTGGASSGTGGSGALLACPETCSGGCSSGTCHILCDDEQECKEARLQCPGGWACAVACLGEQGCEKAVVECGDASECSVRCSGYQGCKEMSLRCGGAECSVECVGQNSCEKTRVLCGTGACIATCSPTVEKRPELQECDQALSCEPC